MVKIINRCFLNVAILLLLSAGIEAADRDITQLKNQCSNITLQQRQMAKAAGYDLDSLCSQIPSDSTNQPVTQPINVTPRPTQTQSSNIQNAFEQTADDDLLNDNTIKTRDSSVKLKAFGYELFAGVPSTFAPATDIPVPADYVMGPGDNIRVQFYGKTSAQYELTIQRNGMVQFPELGPISLAGLSFPEMKKLLAERVARQMIGVKISTTMGELRSIQVFVLGEAYRPGSYTVSSLSTMTNALFSSGGITLIGSLRNIQLKRRGKIVARLDLYDLLLSGDTSEDVRLLPGDVLFIPPIGKVASIGGKVKRPAIYELKAEKTTGDLLRLAGGLLPTAYPNASIIERIVDSGERTLVNIDLSTNTGKKIKIKNGDVLNIPSVLDRMDNMVLLSGHVQRPGGVQWWDGMRASDLVKGFEHLLANSDVDYALIKRENLPLRDLLVVPVNLGRALQNPGSVDDVLLHSRDELLVFGKLLSRTSELQDILAQLKRQSGGSQLAKVISIQGNVYFPGEYPLTKNMTVLRLISAAGGLKEASYLSNAEITRHSLSDPELATIEHINLDLNSELTLNSSFSLQAKDKLAIFTIPEYRENLSVVLFGEVRFPGSYEFKRGETLSQVIKRAGGFTSMAHINAAVFTRESLRRQEAKRLEELKDRMRKDIAASELEEIKSGDGLLLKDAEQLLDELTDTEALGRLVISLEEIMSAKVDDIQLKRGDRLMVPTFLQEISVIGEVQHSASHLFNQQWTLDDYLEKSGGLSARADDDRIYVVRADGSVFMPNQSGWLTHQNTMLSAGDTIVVPLDADRIKSLTLWTNVSQIVYQIALGAAAVRSF